MSLRVRFGSFDFNCCYSNLYIVHAPGSCCPESQTTCEYVSHVNIILQRISFTLGYFFRVFLVPRKRIRSFSAPHFVYCLWRRISIRKCCSVSGQMKMCLFLYQNVGKLYPSFSYFLSSKCSMNRIGLANNDLQTWKR